MLVRALARSQIDIMATVNVKVGPFIETDETNHDRFAHFCRLR